MISGVLYALLAGMMWGLIFVGPLIVPEYPAILQSTGRYLALGLIALPGVAGTRACVSSAVRTGAPRWR
jgi:drug/metabolite transporter (DMT)-like permease